MKVEEKDEEDDTFSFMSGDFDANMLDASSTVSSSSSSCSTSVSSSLEEEEVRESGIDSTLDKKNITPKGCIEKTKKEIGHVCGTFARRIMVYGICIGIILAISLMKLFESYTIYDFHFSSSFISYLSNIISIGIIVCYSLDDKRNNKTIIRTDGDSTYDNRNIEKTMNHQTRNKTQEYKHELQQLYIEISRALGSIHAPPLSPPPSPSLLLSIPVSDEIKEFVHTQVQLIHKTDWAIHSIRQISMLKFGSSTTSFCGTNNIPISRIEDASLLPYLQKKTSSTKSVNINPLLGVQSVRKVLYKIMRMQATSYFSYIIMTEESSSSLSSHQNNMMDTMKADFHNFWAPVDNDLRNSPILSISFLQKCRKELVLLLHHVISLSFSTTVTLLSSSMLEEETIHHSQQQQHYNKEFFLANIISGKSHISLLESSFLYCRPHYKPAITTNNNNNTVLYTIQSKLEQALVILWAYDSSILLEEKELLYSKWMNIQKELNKAQEHFHDLRMNSLGLTSPSFDKKEKDQDENSDEETSSNIPFAQKSLTEFLHDGITEGEQTNDDNRNSIEFFPPDKTIVFSGDGCFKKKNTSRKKKKSPSEYNDKITSYNAESTNMNNGLMLFQELQQRLKTIQVADEFEVNNKVFTKNYSLIDEDEQDTEEEESKATTNKSSKTKSNTFWLGASGSLLNELQNVLNIDQQEQQQGDIVSE